MGSAEVQKVRSGRQRLRTSKATFPGDVKAAAGRLHLHAGQPFSQMLVIALVAQILDRGAQRLPGRKAPGGADIDHTEARCRVFGAARKARRYARLASYQAHAGVRCPRGSDAAFPAQRQLVGRHLEQRFVKIAVFAAQARIGGMQPVAGGELPVQCGFQAGQRGVAKIDRLHAGAGIGCAAGGDRGAAAQAHAGDVVVDAGAVGGNLVVETFACAFQADLELRRRFRLDLRAAGVVVAVIAQAGLVALAQVGGAEGA